ncbi:C39 family peptidase [Nocardia sp. NPDC001965]
MTEIVLPYDRGIVAQETFYFCGPASTQNVLNSCGIRVSENDLAAQMGTSVNGTDYVGLITPVLNRYLPEAQYRHTYMPNDPPTDSQVETLWTDIRRSIDAGYGVIANIVAPPGNFPRGVKGSVSPAYSGSTVYHYIALMGYDLAARAVWVADSGFWPYGYWIALEQLGTLIPPKGYTAATVEAEFLSSLDDAGRARVLAGFSQLCPWAPSEAAA